MTAKQKLDNIQEILCTVLAILSVEIVFSFLMVLTPIANYIGVKYENQYYNKYIYVEGKVNSYLLEETQKVLDNIPQSLLSNFYEDNRMVNVTNVRKKSSYEHGNDIVEFSVGGTFNPREEGSITVINELSSITDGTLEHEFGHYLDYLFGIISEKEPFNSIYLDEYESFKIHMNNSRYYERNKEYFAETFSEYLKNQEELKKHCPETFKYFKFLINNVQ